MKLYEILVPTHSPEGIKYTDEYHREWDQKVCDITGGLTLLKPVEGTWVGENGTIKESMVPVRIAMEDHEIDAVLDLTIEWYDQESVMIYKISDFVLIKEKKDVVGKCPKCQGEGGFYQETIPTSIGFPVKRTWTRKKQCDQCHGTGTRTIKGVTRASCYQCRGTGSIEIEDCTINE
jgi:hypothetical protein